MLTTSVREKKFCDETPDARLSGGWQEGPEAAQTGSEADLEEAASRLVGVSNCELTKRRTGGRRSADEIESCRRQRSPCESGTRPAISPSHHLHRGTESCRTWTDPSWDLLVLLRSPNQNPRRRWMVGPPAEWSLRGDCRWVKSNAECWDDGRRLGRRRRG